jgi:hypothetical protein
MRLFFRDWPSLDEAVWRGRSFSKRRNLGRVVGRQERNETYAITTTYCDALNNLTCGIEYSTPNRNSQLFTRGRPLLPVPLCPSPPTGIRAVLAKGAEDPSQTSSLKSVNLTSVECCSLFYNTGIQTYVWILTNRKAKARRGKVQLVDASSERFWRAMRRSLGSYELA